MMLTYILNNSTIFTTLNGQRNFLLLTKEFRLPAFVSEFLIQFIPLFQPKPLYEERFHYLVNGL